MSKTRLEAFSDAVIAIVITIAILEIKVPHGTGAQDIRPLLPLLLSYVLSFVYVGIYWNNHHHLLQACTSATAGILWSNLHLLFWLSLMPFSAEWMGENHFAAVPTALYGSVLLMTGFAYLLLQQRIVSAQGQGARLRAVIGLDWKGKGTMSLYIAAVALTLVSPHVAQALFVIGAFVWLVPDRRIEATLRS